MARIVAVFAVHKRACVGHGWPDECPCCPYRVVVDVEFEAPPEGGVRDGIARARAAALAEAEERAEALP